MAAQAMRQSTSWMTAALQHIYSAVLETPKVPLMYPLHAPSVSSHIAVIKVHMHVRMHMLEACTHNSLASLCTLPSRIRHACHAVHELQTLHLVLASGPVLHALCLDCIKITCTKRVVTIARLGTPWAQLPS